MSRKLNPVFHVVDAGMILTEPNGIIVEVSEEVRSILGYHGSLELLERGIFELTVP